MDNNLNISLLSALESLTSSSSLAGKTDGTSGSDSTFQQTMLKLLEQMNPANAASASSPSKLSSLSGLSGASDSSLAFEMMMITLLSQLIKQQATPAASAATAAAPVAVPPKEVPSGSPVQGPISQGSHTGHVAIDFAVVVGTPVHATMDGTVVYAGWNNDGYGNLVIVENGAHRTYYAHNSQIPLKVGDQVKNGDVVAYSGSTGHSTGPHVHYETRVNGICVDPTASLG